MSTFIAPEELARAASAAHAWQQQRRRERDPRALVLRMRAWLRHATKTGRGGIPPPADWEDAVDDWLETLDVNRGGIHAAD